MAETGLIPVDETYRGMIRPLSDFPIGVRAIWPGAEVMSPSDAAERKAFFAEVEQCRIANAVIYSGKRRK